MHTLCISNYVIDLCRILPLIADSDEVSKFSYTLFAFLTFYILRRR